MLRYGLGFTGAHRTGKTRLCEVVAAKTGIAFARTSCSAVFTSMGYSADKEYPLGTRISIQHAILEDSISKWKNYCVSGTQFITDRTPIDFIAYTLAAVRQDELTPELDFQLQCYFDLCLKAANDMFRLFIEVLPGISVVPEKGKASIAPSHIDHISKLISGVLVQSNGLNYYTIPKGIVDLDDRCNLCVSAIQEAR